MRETQQSCTHLVLIHYDFIKVNALYRGVALAHNDVLGQDPATKGLDFREELRQGPK